MQVPESEDQSQELQYLKAGKDGDQQLKKRERKFALPLVFLLIQPLTD